MSIEENKLKNAIEAALMAFAQPLSVDRLLSLFEDQEGVTRQNVKDSLQVLQEECVDRGVELVEVASGFRYQARQDYAAWVAKLWEEKPPRYSRALLETLVLVAYRQPITRGEIEDIRGVSVSSHIMKTLQERDWVRVVGHKDVPGKPALYATTKGFLDYFNLKSLEELPPLSEIRDLDKINAELNLDAAGEIEQVAGEDEVNDEASPEETALQTDVTGPTDENQDIQVTEDETPDNTASTDLRHDDSTRQGLQDPDTVVDEIEEIQESQQSTSGSDEQSIADHETKEPSQPEVDKSVADDDASAVMVEPVESTDIDIDVEPLDVLTEPEAEVPTEPDLNDDQLAAMNTQQPQSVEFNPEQEQSFEMEPDDLAEQPELDNESAAEERLQAHVMEEVSQNEINDPEFDQENEFENNRATVAE